MWKWKNEYATIPAFMELTILSAMSCENYNTCSVYEDTGGHDQFFKGKSKVSQKRYIS